MRAPPPGCMLMLHYLMMLLWYIVETSFAHSAVVRSPAYSLTEKHNLHYRECWECIDSRRDTPHHIRSDRVVGTRKMHRKSLKNNGYGDGMSTTVAVNEHAENIVSAQYSYQIHRKSDHCRCCQGKHMR